VFINVQNVIIREQTDVMMVSLNDHMTKCEDCFKTNEKKCELFL